MKKASNLPPPGATRPPLPEGAVFTPLPQGPTHGAKPLKIVTVTAVDGRAVAIAANYIAAIYEPIGTDKAAGIGAQVFYKGIAGGASGVNTKESHDDLLAAWRMALGVKGGVQ